MVISNERDIDLLRSELSACKEKLEAAKRDAERYRWIRSKGFAHVRIHQMTTDTSDVGLDAAIDAVRKEIKP